MTPSFSTLISREESSSQSREVAEGVFPRSPLHGECVLPEPESNRMLIRTHSKLGPVSNEFSLLFSTEISLHKLICLQIP